MRRGPLLGFLVVLLLGGAIAAWWLLRAPSSSDAAPARVDRQGSGDAASPTLPGPGRRDGSSDEAPAVVDSQGSGDAASPTLAGPSRRDGTRLEGGSSVLPPAPPGGAADGSEPARLIVTVVSPRRQPIAGARVVLSAMGVP